MKFFISILTASILSSGFLLAAEPPPTTGEMLPVKAEPRSDHVVQRGKPPGEWNTYEITIKDKEMALWINGAVTAAWHDCQVPKGLVGLEAKGWFIEFQNVKFKPAS